MAHGKNVDSSTLKQWIQNFRSNADPKFITNAATVSLNQLENFINEAKEKYHDASFTGFRIYLIRYPLNDGTHDPNKIKETGDKLSQPSFVLVPVKNHVHGEGLGEDFVLPNPGDLYVLAFSDPTATDPDDSTALCPPRCG